MIMRALSLSSRIYLLLSRVELTLIIELLLLLLLMLGGSCPAAQAHEHADPSQGLTNGGEADGHRGDSVHRR